MADEPPPAHPRRSLAAALFYNASRQSVFVLLRLFYRFRWTGAGNVPRRGPVLIIANHQSYLDPPMVGIAVTVRHSDFIARLGLFTNPLLGRVIAALGSVPIKEEGGDTAAMKEVLRRLGQGRPVIVFPEGSRSPDGTVQPFKRGIALLVKRARCPVVPVGLDGAHDAWPRGSRPKAFGRRIAAVIGRPIDSETLMAAGSDAGLERLRLEVDRLRLEARAMLRRDSHGAYPPPGPADGPCAPAPVS